MATHVEKRRRPVKDRFRGMSTVKAQPILAWMEQVSRKMVREAHQSPPAEHLHPAVIVEARSANDVSVSGRWMRFWAFPTKPIPRKTDDDLIAPRHYIRESDGWTPNVLYVDMRHHDPK